MHLLTLIYPLAILFIRYWATLHFPSLGDLIRETSLDAGLAMLMVTHHDQNFFTGRYD
jgi:K+-transporting ATPase c subunit